MLAVGLDLTSMMKLHGALEVVVAAGGETSSTNILSLSDDAEPSIMASRESGGGEVQGRSSDMSLEDWGLEGGSLPNGRGTGVDWVGSVSSVLLAVTLSVMFASPTGILGALDDPFAIWLKTRALRAADMGPIRI